MNETPSLAMIPESLLIVDDNELFRRSIGKLLKLVSEGKIQRVYEAASGAAAIQTLQHHPVECVLLDYRLPDEDGLHWLERMLALHPDTAVIMITGEGDEKTAVTAMKSGAMDYLVKESMNEMELLRAIANATEKKAMRKALEEQRGQLLQAERQRAMIASLAAACHHLGQPASVIMMYLEMMKGRESSPDMKDMIENSLKAAEGIADILSKLKNVNEYRTIPYLPTWKPDRPGKTPEMLDI